jgi:hypothetical protein
MSQIPWGDKHSSYSGFVAAASYWRFLARSPTSAQFHKKPQGHVDRESAAFSTSYYAVTGISRRFNIHITLLALLRLAAFV